MIVDLVYYRVSRIDRRAFGGDFTTFEADV